MAFEVRNLTLDDYDQASYLESTAFYNNPTPERAEQLRKWFPPDWTLGGFVDGKLVADVRAIPFTRMMSGVEQPFAAVGPVASLAGYRRQGFTGRVLTASLAQMRERGQVMSGLFTPHDELYRRYGWERAESKMRYNFPPRDVRLRFRGSGGRTVQGDAEDWQRLERVYSAQMIGRNGPIKRSPVWWSEAVTHDFEGDKRTGRWVVVWVNDAGEDRGYVVYQNRTTGLKQNGWEQWDIWIRDFVALDKDAYLGLWEHMFTHDLAATVTAEMRPDDPFPDVCVEPQKVHASRAEGPMIRVVDLEKAFELRPYPGEKAAAFTMHVEDHSAPWNTGTWRIEAADGKTSAKKVHGVADVELSANFVAPLYTGYVTPAMAAATGMMRVHHLAAIEEMARALAVTDIPYSQDYY